MNRFNIYGNEAVVLNDGFQLYFDNVQNGYYGSFSLSAFPFKNIAITRLRVKAHATDLATFTLTQPISAYCNLQFVGTPGNEINDLRLIDPLPPPGTLTRSFSVVATDAADWIGFLQIFKQATNQTLIAGVAPLPVGLDLAQLDVSLEMLGW